MSQAYTPGLKVSPRYRHRVRRTLPIAGEVLVTKGQKVKAQDVVARTYMPGDVTPINLANVLSLSPGDVPGCMLKKEGERIEVGETIARTKGLFGMFKTEYKANVGGTIESISKVTGQMMVRGEPLPIQVLAFLEGEVIEVLPKEGAIIESDIAYVQGIFGIGGEAYGPLTMACAAHDQELTEDLIQASMRGSVIVGGARVTSTAIRRAVELGAVAIVTGGLDDQDLRDFLGYDLGVAITGSERVGLTLVITEGFGDIAMARRTFDLLASHKGHAAAVSGATQIRAGVIRPEVVIPLGEDAAAKASATADALAVALAPGTPVRLIRDPYFGLIGKVSKLPSEPQTLDSGSKARVLEVVVEAGQTVVVPRANVELIEGQT